MIPALRFFDASPLWTLEDDTLVGFDLSFTQGLRLTGIETTCETDEALADLSRALGELLCSIPAGAIVRFHSLEIDSNASHLAQFESQFAHHALGAYLARQKAEQCQTDLSPTRRELFCFVSTPPAAPFAAYSPGLLGRRAAKLRQRAQALHLEKLQEVSRIRKTVARGLEHAGVRTVALGGPDVFGAVWRMANPLRSRLAAPPGHRPRQSLREQLLLSGVLNHLDRFEREGALHRVLTLKVSPKEVVPTQVRELQQLPFVHHVCVTLRRVGEQDALRRVERSRRQGHELNAMLARLRGAHRHAEMPDHGLLRQQADVNDVLARLGAGERLYDMAIQLWLTADTEDDLTAFTEQGLSAFRACGEAEGAIEEMRGRFAFLSMLPGHHTLVGDRYHALLASRAADLLPVFGSHRGSEKATTLLSTRSGDLVGFHPFDPELPAWNATIAGGTGSGKSFTARILLSGWLASGGRAVIATRGRDYHRYAELFDGGIRDVSVEDPNLALGPFLSADALAEHRHPEVVLQHLASVLALMATEPGTSPDRTTRRLIGETTRRLYEMAPPGAEPGFDDWLAQLEELSAEEPEHAPRAAALQAHLRFWLDGAWGPALRRNPAQAAENLSVWNLEAVGDTDTQSVVLALLSAVIRRSIAAGPTLVVLDEVWSLLRSEAGAELAEVLYRTVRKEGSAIWTISQSMNDYALLPESARSAVLNNSPIKLFLQHDPSDLDLVATTFDLSAREREMLADLRSLPGRYSDLLASMGRRRQVLRVVPTAFEYWLCTSHPADTRMEALATRAAPQLDRLELIKRLARRFPNGAIEIDNPYAA